MLVKRRDVFLSPVAHLYKVAFCTHSHLELCGGGVNKMSQKPQIPEHKIPVAIHHPLIKQCYIKNFLHI